MHYPPRPPTLRQTGITLALCSALLLTLVAVEWRPLIDVDARIARTTHRWAVEDHGLTHTFRILTDWVWDPLTLRLVCAAAMVWLVWRRSAWWTALWLGATCALGTLLQQTLKALVNRPRPVWPDPVDSAAPGSRWSTALRCCAAAWCGRASNGRSKSCTATSPCP